MKRLTLDQTWEQCLAMWKWISRQCKGKSWQWCRANVLKLKCEWLKANGIFHIGVLNNCLFCEFTKVVSCEYQDCWECPGKKVTIAFNCHKREYHYQNHPRRFYAKLKELNKIRLAKK